MARCSPRRRRASNHAPKLVQCARSSAMTADLPAFLPALPEIVLAVGALVLLLIGAYGGERMTPLITGLSVALIVVAGGLLLFHSVQGTSFSGAFVLDPYARLMKILTLIGSGVAIVMSIGYLRSAKIERFEYPVLVVIATLGMMMMISATDLIALYLGLELQSLALYVVAAINR